MINLTQEELMFGAAIALAAVCLITIILLIITLCKLKKLRRRVDDLTRGKDTESMEDIMLNFFERIESLEEGEKVTRSDIRSIKDNLKITYQKTGLVKYDAFRELINTPLFSLSRSARE